MHVKCFSIVGLGFSLSYIFWSNKIQDLYLQYNSTITLTNFHQFDRLFFQGYKTYLEQQIGEISFRRIAHSVSSDFARCAVFACVQNQGCSDFFDSLIAIVCLQKSLRSPVPDLIHFWA